MAVHGTTKASFTSGIISRKAEEGELDHAMPLNERRRVRTKSGDNLAIFGDELRSTSAG